MLDSLLLRRAGLSLLHLRAVLDSLLLRRAGVSSDGPDEYAFSCSADMLSMSRPRSSAAQPAFNERA